MQRLKNALKNFDEESHLLIYWIVYTIFWLFMAYIVYHYLKIYHKTLIWNNDGFHQHLKALIYYRNYLRTIIKSIFISHSFKWGNYSFAMGYGQGFYTVLHYYVIGDPFALLYVICPKGQLIHGYEFLILLRIYLAGLSFSALCHDYRKDQNIGKLAASISYCLGGYILFAGLKHPYFINPFIYLPLLLMGARRMLKHQSPILFIAMVFITCASNFYFFYIQVVLLILYVIAYCIFNRVKIKEILIYLRNFISAGLLGTLMGFFVLLPVIISILTDSGGRQAFFENIYTGNYYSNLLATFIGYYENGEWTVIGAGALCLVGVVYLFFDRRKDAHLLRGLLLLFTIFLLLPICGFALNGFQYVSNRWDFGYVLLISMILFYEWDQITAKKNILPFIVSIVILGLGVYHCYGLMNQKLTSDLVNEEAWTMLKMGIIFMIVMLVVYQSMLRKTTLLVFAASCIGMNSYYAYSKDQMNILDRQCSYKQVAHTLKENEAAEISRLDNGKTFYRYSGLAPYENLGLLSGVSSTSYDWSLVNMNINHFYDHQGVTASMIHHFKTLNERAYLNALASVKYYVSAFDAPYGYTLVKHVNDRKNSAFEDYEYNIYKNNYALPLGYTYDSIISQKDYDQMDMASRYEAIMQGAVVSESVRMPATQVNDLHHNVKFKKVYDKKAMRIKGDQIIVKKGKATIDLYYEPVKNSEIYLQVKGYDFKDFYLSDPPLDRDQAGSQRVVLDYVTYANNHLLSAKEFYYYTKLYSRNSGRHDFMINTGYSKKGSDHVTISFRTPGVYNCKSLKMIAQPMTDYKKYIRKLKKDVLTDVSYRRSNKAQTTYDVKGKITLHKRKLLCLSIPYEDGWQVYVDGKETTLLKVNDMYMGVVLNKGTHQIRLVYHTPGLKAGLIISVIAGIGFIILIIRRKNKATLSQEANLSITPPMR